MTLIANTSSDNLMKTGDVTIDNLMKTGDVTIDKH